MNAALVEGCRNALQMGVALLLQSGLLLLLGLMAGWLLRRRGPELRAFVSQMTLAGVALGAVLSVTLSGHVQPVWGVRLGTPRPMGTPPSRLGSPPPPAGEDGRSDGQGAGPIRQFQSAVLPPAPRNGPLLAKPRQRGEEVASLSETEGSPLPEGSLALLWPAVTGLLLLWLLACQGHLTRLRRAASPVTVGPAAEALAHLSALRRVRAPLLLQSQHVRSPFLAGLRRPAIFFPSTWEADYDDATLRAVLAHELAHLTRRDCTWTLLLRLTTALLWPQPLLWLLARQLDQATEEACDLLAVTPDCPPRRYADCLLRLADRALPGPAARTLGAGVVPVRSSLGRRIQQVLSAGQRVPLSPRLRVGFVMFWCVAALGMAFVFAAAPPAPPGYGWAKAQDWQAQPITIVDLDRGWPSRLTPPPGVTPQDVALTKSCRPDFSGHEFWRYHDRKTGSPTAALRNAYVRLLDVHPHFFYAEYGLAKWYWDRGDRARYWLWLQQSLRDAPRVLAGRIQYDDGRPAAGVEFSTEIDCYNSADLRDRHGLDLDFQTVVTDAEGCYYLPVYQAIYSRLSIGWHPDLLRKRFGDVTLETPGPATSNTVFVGSAPGRLSKGFVAEGRVGVLQTTFIRPRLQLTAPFVGATGSDEHPLLLRGAEVTVAWRPYPGAVRYTVSLDEVHRHMTKGEHGRDVSSEMWHGIAGTDPHFDRGSPLTHMHLAMSGQDPLFDRGLQYHLTVIAHSTQDTASNDTLSQSEQYDFRVAQGLAPQPLTKAALARDIGPGAVITSLTAPQGKIIALGAAPHDTLDAIEKSDGWVSLGKRYGLEFGGESNGGAATGAGTFRLTFTR